VALYRFGFVFCLLAGACDFGIDTTGLAGEGGILPDTGSDVTQDDAGDESTPPDDTGPQDTGPPHLFGDTAVESNAKSVNVGDPDGFQYQAIAGGSAATVLVYVDSQSSGASFDVGLYDDDSSSSPSKPKGLLAFATFNSPSSGGWASASLNQSITITQGSNYWIVVHPTSGTLVIDVANGGGLESVSTNNQNLPATWSTASTSTNGPASMYVTQ
jgi:hypothetical protein